MKYNFVQKNIIKREKHFFFLLAIYAIIITFVIVIISKHFPIKPIHYPIKERLKFFISGNNFAENLFFSGHNWYTNARVSRPTILVGSVCNELGEAYFIFFCKIFQLGNSVLVLRCKAIALHVIYGFCIK